MASPAPVPPASSLTPVRVWDLPTRLFHWTLALTVIGSVISAKVGGNAMEWHFRLGALVMALVVFRVLWGLLGGRWSRFSSFIYAPGTVLRYLRGQGRRDEHLDVGHNPLGSFSVFALLGFLALQVATGLVADDEIANVGPLNRFAGAGLVSRATSWHKEYGQWLVIALVLLHVAAIVFYLVKKRQNLVRPMLSGDKTLPAGTPASADGRAQRVLALVLFAGCGAAAAWILSLGQ